jgi:hypothetical protein
MFLRGVVDETSILAIHPHAVRNGAQSFSVQRQAGCLVCHFALALVPGHSITRKPPLAAPLTGDHLEGVHRCSILGGIRSQGSIWKVRERHHGVVPSSRKNWLLRHVREEWGRRKKVGMRGRRSRDRRRERRWRGRDALNRGASGCSSEVWQIGRELMPALEDLGECITFILFRTR